MGALLAGAPLGLVGCTVEGDRETRAGDGAIDRPWSAPSGSADLAPVSPDHLCVTAGTIHERSDGLFSVDDGGMRAVVRGDASRSAELAFRYRGPSSDTAPLANGETRRQIGLKLRARDTCNVIYVMWHVEPTPGVFVSVKANPDLTTHAACGDGGYVNVKPARSASPAALRVDDSHVLRADLDGRVLRVTADRVVVWEGALPEVAGRIEGPAGMRSDNGVFDFELRAATPASAAAICPSS